MEGDDVNREHLVPILNVSMRCPSLQGPHTNRQGRASWGWEGFNLQYCQKHHFCSSSWEGRVLSTTGNLLATSIFSVVQFGDAVMSLMMILVVLTPPASMVLQSG